MTAGSVLVGYDRVAGLLGTAGFPEEQVMLWVSVLDSYALALFPSLAVLILVLALNLIGDGLRDAIDPNLRTES